MDELDIRLLKMVQDGLKLTRRPYRVLGEKMEMSEEEVIQRLSSLVDDGVVRRFAAAIGHRALGIVANAMIVWRGSSAGCGKNRPYHCLLRGRYPLL